MPKREPAPSDGPSATRRPTSYDVAQLAGVSQSAVSRCFRPGSSIAPATRQKVLRAANELGYQPNAIASGLITRRSNMVAVLISNLTNLYYPEVLAGLSTKLDAQGVRVLLFALAKEGDADSALDQIWRYRVDGAIAAVKLSEEQLARFAQHHVPVVLYNRFGESEPVASVCCDSIAGERLLVGGLLDAGHRRFGIIAGPEDSYVGRQRVEGALARLGEAGITPAITGGSFDYESGAAGLRKLMTMSSNKLDAIICTNDLMAVGAIDAAREVYGLDVPRQLSVVGFDGVSPASWASYRVTTVRQPVGRMTDAAVAMLMERIADPELPPEVRTFAGKLQAGGSARLG